MYVHVRMYVLVHVYVHVHVTWINLPWVAIHSCWTYVHLTEMHVHVYGYSFLVQGLCVSAYTVQIWYIISGKKASLRTLLIWHLSNSGVHMAHKYT